MAVKIQQEKPIVGRSQRRRYQARELLREVNKTHVFNVAEAQDMVEMAKELMPTQATKNLHAEQARNAAQWKNRAIQRELDRMARLAKQLEEQLVVVERLKQTSSCVTVTKPVSQSASPLVMPKVGDVPIANIIATPLGRPRAGTYTVTTENVHSGKDSMSPDTRRKLHSRPEIDQDYVATWEAMVDGVVPICHATPTGIASVSRIAETSKLMRSGNYSELHVAASAMRQSYPWGSGIGGVNPPPIGDGIDQPPPLPPRPTHNGFSPQDLTFQQLAERATVSERQTESPEEAKRLADAYAKEVVNLTEKKKTRGEIIAGEIAENAANKEADAKLHREAAEKAHTRSADVEAYRHANTVAQVTEDVQTIVKGMIAEDCTANTTVKTVRGNTDYETVVKMNKPGKGKKPLDMSQTPLKPQALRFNIFERRDVKKQWEGRSKSAMYVPTELTAHLKLYGGISQRTPADLQALYRRGLAFINSHEIPKQTNDAELANQLITAVTAAMIPTEAELKMHQVLKSDRVWHAIHTASDTARGILGKTGFFRRSRNLPSAK
jgi:hypothetical protein